MCSCHYRLLVFCVHTPSIHRNLALIGLNYIHSLNPSIIHRDIKQANVLMHVTNEGDVVYKLCDFGLARELEVDRNARTFLGTPTTIAPEVVGRQPYTVSADLWSIGLVMYECLLGGPLFVGDNEDIVMFSVLSRPLPKCVGTKHVVAVPFVVCL